MLAEKELSPEHEPLSDIPRSKEIFRGDINDAVIQTQIQTGVEIDKGWWDMQVGDHGTTESILERYDAAYPEYIERHTAVQADEQVGVDESTTQEHNRADMNNPKEEAAWDDYIPIDSDDYQQANQERIGGGKIKVDTIGDEEHSVTLIASIKVDPETGQAISGHESRPDAESMRDTEVAFADYLTDTPPEQRTVIYEGDEGVFDDRDEAIRRAADSGLVQHLAAREDVPTVSGEPTEAETTEVMEKLGVNKEELLALYVARGLESQSTSEQADFLAGYINHQAATLGIEGFRAFTDAEKQEIIGTSQFEVVKTELNQKVAELLPGLNELYRPALDGKDLFTVADDGAVTVSSEFQENAPALAMDKLGWSGEHRINQVARLNMEMRDRAIFHRIAEAYEAGKNPLVVYGGSHAVTLKPVVQSYVDRTRK